MTWFPSIPESTRSLSSATTSRRGAEKRRSGGESGASFSSAPRPLCLSPPFPMTHGIDIRWMDRAIDLAECGRYTVSPNPMVGAVVVSGGKAVGEGFHERAGEPHAEVRALERAGEAARAADLYVSLEPCAPSRRTPPCCAA